MLGGLGNDNIVVAAGGGPTSLIFGNEGNDTLLAIGADAATVVGGNDSADGSDSIVGGVGSDIIFGNGGADTIQPGGAAPIR